MTEGSAIGKKFLINTSAAAANNPALGAIAE